MKRAEKILEILKNTYPHAKCALDHENVFQLLVATVLSAQSTDKNINKLTKKLFQYVKSAEDIHKMDQEKLEKMIYSAGFYRQKAKNLKLLSEKIVKEHKNQVPKKMEKLIKLNGVARKTANIVLETGYNVTDGIAVDTHVKRISKLLNLTKNQNPNKIEQDLCKTFSRKDWGKINHLMVTHGRNICIANRPKCDKCPLFELCPSRKIFES
ncbi:MAG: endonuclease III [Candidatus Gracilibacteria bacterium]|jgi:endonuclease-3|nr:endonuclease III [Candidatus Gracilibacteria bacterium]